MGKLKGDFPGIPFIALTATANARIQEDVLSNLGMTGALVLTQSFNRPNLKYEVRAKSSKVIEDIAEFINDHHSGECGIIYCSSQAKCEDVAAGLRNKYRIEARHYHAVRFYFAFPFCPSALDLLTPSYVCNLQGMSAGDRARIQIGWQEGDFQVICATIA